MNESTADQLVRCWFQMFREVNKDSKKPIAPPSLTHYEAEAIVRSTPAVEWFPDDRDLVDELRRIAGIFHEKGWPIFRARPVIEKVGRYFEGVSEPNPVNWSKDPDPDEPIVSRSERVRAIVKLASGDRADA